MKTVDIGLRDLRPAPWNPNRMEEQTLSRLKESLMRYGLVEPLVVRPIGDGYEVLSGNQRLRAIQEIGEDKAPCVVVDLDDAEAMLLAQTLNNLRGEDDQLLKGNLLKSILDSIPEDRVLSLLPETSESLKAITSFTETDLAAHLQSWDEAQSARLKHMQLQFTGKQLETVEEALARILPQAKGAQDGNPNQRGNAFYLLCRFYLEKAGEE